MTGAKCSSNRRKLLLQTNRKPLKPSQSQPQKRIRLAGFFRFVLRYFRLGVWFLHPVSDLYYYGAAILSMAAILVSFISIIHAYNLLSTRRLPQFDKQGGDDRA